MWFVLIYLLVAGVGIGLTTLWLNKTRSHDWSIWTFVRGGLACSAILLAIDALLFLVLGYWPLSPFMAVAFGIGLPVIMTVIT